MDAKDFNLQESVRGGKIVLRRFKDLAMSRPDGLEQLEAAAQELKEFAGEPGPDGTREPEQFEAWRQYNWLDGYVQTSRKVHRDLCQGE